jgi:hypothetical protein
MANGSGNSSDKSKIDMEVANKYAKLDGSNYIFRKKLLKEEIVIL